MKNLSIVLNVVLLVAVIILYVLHFKGVPSSEEHAAGSTETVHAVPVAPGASIVYVNTDSLLDNYDYFTTKQDEFRAKQERIRNELKSENDKLQKDVSDYQEKAGGMTEMQRQQTEEQLMMRQQKLMQKKDELMGQLDDEQNKSSEDLYKRLASFLKDYNKGKNYQYIMGYQRGGGILFASDSLDITSDVLQGLNKAYSAEKK